MRSCGRLQLSWDTRSLVHRHHFCDDPVGHLEWGRDWMRILHFSTEHFVVMCVLLCLGPQ